MSVIGHNVLLGASGNQGGYTVGRSLRFRSSASAYLSRTSVASPTNTLKWTISLWVKRGILGVQKSIVGANVGAAYTSVSFLSGDTLRINYNNGTNAQLVTTQVFRDPSAWYHIVVVSDSANATASNRILLYVNGVQVTSFSTATYPTTTTAAEWNTGSSAQTLGTASTEYIDAYLAEVNSIDGQALTPSSFGAYDTNGVWQPKKYTGTYGTNGFYLPFSNTTSTTTLVADSSGNGNNWTPNNISLTAGTTYDSMIDSPSNAAGSTTNVGNYPVFSPIDKTGGITLTNGNLTVAANGASDSGIRGTIGVTSGKWYWEIYCTAVNIGAGSQRCQIGIATPLYNITVYNDAYAWSYLSQNGNKYNNATATAYGATYGTGDTIGVAFDADAGTLVFYKNNVSQGTAFTGLTSGPYIPMINAVVSGTTVDANFGQRPFTYTPPSGYNALNTYNLPTPTIKNGASYMAATLYTGTGTTLSVNNGNNNTIGTTFAPNLVWIKSRSGAFNHELYDTVRGATLRIDSNLTNAESTSTLGLTSFNSNGFTQGGQTETGANGSTYDSWQWKAGTASGSSNTSGSITSTVSADTTAGFSVVTWTGNGVNAATVGHGLGVAPNMIIVKSRTNGAAATGAWYIYHSAIGAANYLVLNTTAAQVAGGQWFSTTPTSSFFYVGGTGNYVNESGSSQVAYCFAAVRGYSAFGKYTGNGAADGAFVYLGFRPRWVMIKRSDSTGAWNIFDTSLNPYNLSTQSLVANTNAAENTGTTIVLDILSNGMKMRSSDAALNSGTLIYAAFAENPLNYARAR